MVAPDNQGETHTQPDSAGAQAASASGSPQGESLLERLGASAALLGQIWRDRVALAQAEVRLALKSALLIIVLLCALGVVLVLTWVVLMGTLAYFLAQQGLYWLWIAGILLLAQLLLILAIHWKIQRLLPALTLPATRQAFRPLPDHAEPSAAPAPEGGPEGGENGDSGASGGAGRGSPSGASP